MPPVLRESLLFPYTGGLTFTQRLHGAGGWEAVNDAFAKPPASTEQILHPEKYDSGEAPLEVDLPDDLAARMGAGWKVGLEDTLGEFQLKVWLAETAGDGAASAATAAAGLGRRPRRTPRRARRSMGDRHADPMGYGERRRRIRPGRRSWPSTTRAVSDSTSDRGPTTGTSLGPIARS